MSERIVARTEAGEHAVGRFTHIAARSHPGRKSRSDFLSLRREAASAVGSVAVSAAALLFTACAPKAEHATSAFQVDTIGGVVHARNTGPAPTLDADRHTWSPAAAASAPPLGAVWSLVADPAGNVYLADESNARIVVFDSAGRFRRVLGRRGHGPGEFEDLASLAWAGDTIAALDWRNGRVMFLGTDGSWRGSVPAQPISGPEIRLRRAGGTFYQPGYRPAPGGHGIERLLIGYHGAGLRDTLVLPDMRIEGNAVECSANGGIAGFSVPFAPTSIVTVSPDGDVVAARSDDYRIAFLRPNGDTARVVARDVAPVPVTDSEWAAGTAEFREFRRKYPNANCQPAEMTRPGAKAPLRSISFDPHGQMWVERWTVDGVAFDLFAQSGRLVGEVSAPLRDEMVPPYVRGGKVYLAVPDSTGEDGVTVIGVTGVSAGR